MSTPTEWLNGIWSSSLPSNSKLIAAHLRSYLHNGKYECFPSIKRIMEKCSISKSTTHKYLNVLLKERWLARESGFEGKSNHYFILFGNIATLDNSQGRSLDGQDSTPYEPNGCAKQTLKSNRKTNRKKRKDDIFARYQDISWANDIDTQN